jgi:hypothetical protein
MNLTLAYAGRSSWETTRRGSLLTLSPNLSRELVAFDAPLLKPLRFREAISALHEIVVGDLRYKPKDKTAYLKWKEERAREERLAYQAAYDKAKAEVLRAQKIPMPAGFEDEYKRCLGRYWQVRRQYSRYLLLHHPSLWRQLMPCDPIVTVANDALLFEGFSKDESSYGCLSVDRDRGFGRSDEAKLGTTNVDYSQDLFENFQAMRSYRETRFRVDPRGFEVATQGREDYREEKIDLPSSWLAGFVQVQAAMGLPSRVARLTPGAVRSILAWLKRHREKDSPRSLRFELLPGDAPRIVLEPWEQVIVSEGTIYDGSPCAPIRVWGRRRLMALARVLPLADRFEVHLLGSGLPTFWIAQMGEMRLTLGLSGWTANDWTRSSSLDLLFPSANPSPQTVERVAQYLRQYRRAPFEEIREGVLAPPEEIAAALNQLARTGQAIRDLDAGAFRWRQIMPRALGEAELGPEHPEAAGAKDILRRLGDKLKVSADEKTADGLRRVAGQVDGKKAEILLDADGRMTNGQCQCSFHRESGFRQGPCRHMLVLAQLTARKSGPLPESEEKTGGFFDNLMRWGRN